MATPDAPPVADGSAKAPVCPTCGRPRDPRFKPFCSARCRDVDLLRWFKGEYGIPATEVEPDDDAKEGRDES